MLGDERQAFRRGAGSGTDRINRRALILTIPTSKIPRRSHRYRFYEAGVGVKQEMSALRPGRRARVGRRRQVAHSRV